MTETTKYHKLYDAVNKMMACLGAEGTISTHAPEVDAVMSALYDIDGGCTCNEIYTIMDLIMAEAARRFVDEKADHGCMGSFASKAHSVMMDLYLELGCCMEIKNVKATCVEEK